MGFTQKECGHVAAVSHDSTAMFKNNIKATVELGKRFNHEHTIKKINMTCVEQIYEH